MIFLCKFLLEIWLKELIFKFINIVYNYLLINTTYFNLLIKMKKGNGKYYSNNILQIIF
jgi:hypothetical protein